MRKIAKLFNPTICCLVSLVLFVCTVFSQDSTNVNNCQHEQVRQVQYPIKLAQFEGMGESAQVQQIQFIDSYDNLSLIDCLRGNHPNIHQKRGNISFQYRYGQKDFTDATSWDELLRFPPSTSFEDDNDKHQIEYTRITSIDVCFTNKGYLYPSRVIEEETIEFRTSSRYLLRQLEVVLRNIRLSIRLINEEPLMGEGGSGGGGGANLRTHNIGHLTVNTTKGNFNIRLSFPLTLTSDGSKLEYPFENYGMASIISEILHSKTSKYLPVDVFDRWSGEATKKKLLREMECCLCPCPSVVRECASPTDVREAENVVSKAETGEKQGDLTEKKP